MVLLDFNIEDAAVGPGKPVIKTFITNVTHNTLKIQLYWAGKGTTGIPTRGMYGPLISAISVTPSKFCNFQWLLLLHSITATKLDNAVKFFDITLFLSFRF